MLVAEFWVLKKVDTGLYLVYIMVDERGKVT